MPTRRAAIVPFSRARRRSAVSPSPADRIGMTAVEMALGRRRPPPPRSARSRRCRPPIGGEGTQHEQVEARVDDLQEAPDLRPDAVAVRGREQRPGDPIPPRASSAVRRPPSRAAPTWPRPARRARPVSPTTSRSIADDHGGDAAEGDEDVCRANRRCGEQARTTGSRPASAARARPAGTRPWCPAGRCMWSGATARTTPATTRDDAEHRGDHEAVADQRPGQARSCGRPGTGRRPACRGRPARR